MSGGMKNFIVSFFTSVIVSIIVFVGCYFYLVPILNNMRKVEVPNLAGTLFDQAKLILESKGLLVSLEGDKESDNIESGKVCEQTPEAGVIINKGDVVKIFVSKGKLKVNVPDFSDINFDEAAMQIEKIELVVGKTEEIYTDKASSGKVVSTNPPFGSEVVKGTSVDFVVSKGTQKITVPSVSGKSLAQAKLILERKGLRLGKIKYTCDEERRFDIVLWQYPTAGKTADKNSTVDITVNSEIGE